MARKKKKLFAFYGVNLDDRSKTGWIKILTECEKGLYEIVDSNLEATAIDCNVPAGNGTKDDWTAFFNSEKELEGWKFHPVGVIRKANPEKS